jgi:phage tail sheath protein FI
MVALLDVPPRLTPTELRRWRDGFDSPYAAAYHPWLRVSRADDRRDPLVAVNPAAYAAGIVARQELAFGVQHGPANVIAIGPVSPTDPVTPQRHDELHQSAVNVFMRERDGLRLTAGRTLSRDPQWRQLSIRRLITMLRRTLLRQMQWTVFEPNDHRLRDELRRMLEAYLRQLFLASAFRGKTPNEAFFVRCDDELNPPSLIDTGKLICHVGVAPAEPLEFIVLRFAREGDGTLLMES